MLRACFHCLRRARRPRLSRRMGAWHGAQDGLAILEMALIMPLIVIAILLMTDLGLLFYGYVGASNSLREGALRRGGLQRCGGDRPRKCGLGFQRPRYAHPAQPRGAQIDDDFTVSGTFDHNWITPIIGGLDLTQYTARSSCGSRPRTSPRPTATHKRALGPPEPAGPRGDRGTTLRASPSGKSRVLRGT